MKQEVKTPRPHSKKLFEWDRSRRLLSVRIKQTEYICELGEDNTFVCIAEKGKTLKSTEKSAEPLDGQ